MRTTSKRIIISILANFAICISAFAISDALKIKILNGTQVDETVIRFIPTATPGFDGSWDAYKLFNSSPVVPSLFTKIDSVTSLSVNAYPELNSEVSVNIYTHIKVNGNYTFQAIELGTGFQPDVQIMLKDNITGISYNFRGGNTVTIPMTANTVNSAARFTVTMTPPMPLQVSTNIICNGSSEGTALFTQSSSSIWHYQLNNSTGNIISSGICTNDSLLLSDLSGGNYTLYTSGPGMNDTIPFVINEYPPVIASFSSQDNVSLSMAQIQFANTSVNASSYTWNLGDGTSSTSFSPVHQYSSAGTYQISLTASDSMGCSATATGTVTVHPDISTGIASNSADSQLNVFQSEGNLKLQLSNDQMSDVIINVFNYTGQIIYSYSNRNVQSYSEMIPVPSSGTYITNAIINNKLISKQVSIIK
jgi:PKD repeat protein